MYQPCIIQWIRSTTVDVALISMLSMINLPASLLTTCPAGCRLLSGPFAQTQAQALGTVLTIRGEPVSHGWPRGNLQRRLFLVGHATPATHQLYLRRGPPQGVFEVCFEGLEDFEGFASRVSTLGATAPVARSIYPLDACLLPGDRCNDGRLQIWMMVIL